jgi:hypothetical protein
LQYNQTKLNFEAKGSIILDVLENISPRYLLLQTVLSNCENSYFYRKNYEGQTQILELMKHQMDLFSNYDFLKDDENQHEVPTNSK